MDPWSDRHETLWDLLYYICEHYLKRSGTPVKISVLYKSTDLTDQLADFMSKPDRPEDFFADLSRGTLNVPESKKKSSGLSG